MTNYKMKDLTPNIMVENIQNTIEYYQTILGFDIVMTFPVNENPLWALLKKNNISMMFQEKNSFLKEYPHLSDIGMGGSLSLFIGIDNIDGFYNEIYKKVKVIKPPHVTTYGIKEFAIEDINGYLLVFAEKQ